MNEREKRSSKLGKGLVSWLLIAVLVLSMSVDVTAKRKTSGEFYKVKWNYNTKTRTLTLDAVGEDILNDYEYHGELCPWQAWGNKIEKLVIKEGAEYLYAIQGRTKKASEKCSNIKSVSLPESLCDIMDNVFSDTKITTIKLPSKLKVIGDDAFSGTQLKKLVIPKQVDDIRTGAFRDCKKLAKVQLPKNLDRISKELFYNCSSLKKITIPSKVKRIKAGAFSKSGLTSITIPKGVKTLEESCFDGCASLKKVNIKMEELTEISPAMFKDCKALKTVKLPDSVVYIAQEVFKGSGLSSYTLPKNIGTIGTEAFADCTQLKEVVFSGKKIKVIGKDAFLNVPEDCVFKVPAGQGEKVKALLIASGASESVIVVEY